VRGTDNPSAIAQRMIDCLPETNRDILGSVVIVDMEIPDRFDSYVKLAMLGKEGQHVIEEADTGICLTLAGAIDIER
jgi:hypothetical protein